MNLPAYEYKGLMAQAWDVLRGDTSDWPDRPYYMGMIQRYGQPVLDVGCGTGRILLDYLQQCIDIDGVDNSPEMLALCRYKAAELGVQPNLYEQYVESLNLPRKYKTILIPSSSLQLIIEPELVDQSLEHLFDHLQPGGGIAASMMTIWQKGDPLESEWAQTSVRSGDGVQFRREAWSRFDPESGCESTKDLYQKLVEDEVISEEKHQRSPATRSYTQAQARELFERAGFSNVQLYSEFTFEPVKRDDKLFVLSGDKL